jgi:serine protease Do
VVTTKSVIDNSTSIEVRALGGARLKANLIAVDSRSDTALLKANVPSNFPFLQFSQSPATIGDSVFIISNPFGLAGSVATGIVSGLDRDLRIGPYDYVQIDAMAQPGSAGGPVVNREGEIVAVVHATQSGPSGAETRIAFALPGKLVDRVATDLKTKGKVRRGWLGVSMMDVTEELAQSLALQEPKGAYIADVAKEGPGGLAGLRQEDVILALDVVPIRNMRELARKVDEMLPDTVASVTVYRKGEEVSLKVKIGQASDTPTSNDENVARLKAGDIQALETKKKTK